MTSRWKLPREVLKPPEDRTCEMLHSEVALKEFMDNNENYDVDPTLKIEYMALKKQVDIDMRSIKNDHVDERCDYIYPNDWSSLYQRKVVVLEKDLLIQTTNRSTFVQSIQYLVVIFIGLGILRNMFSVV